MENTLWGCSDLSPERILIGYVFWEDTQTSTFGKKMQAVSCVHTVCAYSSITVLPESKIHCSLLFLTVSSNLTSPLKFT